MDSNSYFFTNKLNRPPFTFAQNPPQGAATQAGQDPESSMPPTPPISALEAASASLCFIPEWHWTTETHKANIDAVVGVSAGGADSNASKAPDFAHQKLFKRELYHYLRWALSGGASGVGIPAMMTILGRDVCVARILEVRGLSIDEAGKGVKSPATRNSTSCCGKQSCQGGNSGNSKA